MSYCQFLSLSYSRDLNTVKPLSHVQHGFVVMLMALLITLCSSTAYARDIYDLQRSGDVELIAWVGEKPKPGDKITPAKVSVNEQVILNIEVATPRWFTGGHA